jgi:hypothetical protein
MTDFNQAFEHFLEAARHRTQAIFADPTCPLDPPELIQAREALLIYFPEGREIATHVLASPFFPASLLARGMLQDGYLFKYPPRPGHTPQEVLTLKGLRLLTLIPEIVDYYPGRIVSVPLDPKLPPQADALPDGQWCDLCGLCCASFGGVAPMAPKHATYPAHWLDDLWLYEYWCPFLFEYHWTGKLFCAIHAVKPVWCDEFANPEICKKVKQGFGG